MLRAGREEGKQLGNQALDALVHEAGIEFLEVPPAEGDQALKPILHNPLQHLIIRLLLELVGRQRQQAPIHDLVVTNDHVLFYFVEHAIDRD